MKKKSYSLLIVAGVVAALTCSTAFADMLFQDDFESDLSAWTGKTGDVHHGVIVDDPLNTGNHVLAFTQRNAYGDIFTTQAFDLIAGQEYMVSFDYLGFDGKTPGYSGGFAGLSSDYPGTHIWYYGTTSTSQANPILIGDGQWHHYDYTFTAPLEIGDSIHLMFEDFIGIGGDAYFDNIAFHAPVPGALLLGSMGLSLAGWRLKKKRA